MYKAPSFDEDASAMSATDASSSYGDRAFNDEAPSASSVAVGAEEAVTDLMDMEKIQEEAERMKGLGNRHMAAQEYMRAYNAYSAALELNPVGPSSHVFLSNRAAALLSLKRYAAASLDAKRAVALAPTFGKAHARLGQARYFLKDYEGAVAAYEQAVHFEPDNAVTWTYLAKAKNKLARQQGGDTDSAFSSINDTVINSIATDTQGKAGIVSGYGSMGRGADRHATQAIPSLQQEMSRLSVIEDQPPTEVETGPMGPVAGASAGRQVSALGMSSVSHVGLLNTGPSAAAAIGNTDDDEEDPDFDEALRLQRKANRFLANKQYRHAVDEFSAALFLVPDDDNLSPQLYIGRAHALNGARRHTSALNDARQALQLSPNNSEAHCTKARSLFYVQNYADAIEAFEVSIELLGPDQRLSVLDQAYLQKARQSLQEQQMKDLEQSYSADLTSPKTTMPVIPETPPSQYDAYIGPLATVTSPLSASSVTSPSERSNSSIPKLNPPRFVPREQVISSTPNLPPMPKSWPQQSPSSPTFFRVGPERTVTFISEAMGIKLNRGSDGFVRVLKVTPLQKGSPLMREGDMHIGDVVREAAGVDLRRPLTNIMWGDTVALMKMTPRPIDLIVAPELSEPPPSVAEEFAKARAALKVESVLLNQSPSRSYSSYNIRPSPGNGEEPVAESIAAQDERDVMENTVIDENDSEIIETSLSKEGTEEIHIDVAPQETTSSVQNEDIIDANSDDMVQDICLPTTHTPNLDKEEGETEDNVEEDGEGIEEPEPDCSVEEIAHHEEAQYYVEEEASMSATSEESLALKAEVLFGSRCSHGWTNERWMSVPPPERKLRHHGTVSRLTKGRFVWSSEQYVPRTLAIFEHPNLILVLRVPTSVEEVRSLLNLPKGVAITGDTGNENLMDSFLVAESVIDPSTCKLRLSPLTTITSVPELCNKKVDPRRRSCFELLTPSETIALYSGIVKNEPVDSREEADTSDLRDSSGIFLETSTFEEAIGKALQNAHEPYQSDPVWAHSDYAWKHQVILGTLHSFAVSGNVAMLKNAIQAAKEKSSSTGAAVTDSVSGQQFLDPEVIDSKDEGGKTALHYACQRRNSAAVSLLVDAGANCSLCFEPDMSSPCHLAARVLDDKSLSTILATKYPMRPDANTLNALGQTPMYVAAVEGRTIGGSTTPISLGRCLSALDAWDGKFLVDDSKLVNPISAVSSQWRSSELDVILSHCHFLYPLIGANNGISVGALFHYPVHMALISLRKQLMLIRTGKSDHMFGNKDHSLASTLRVLTEHGFEPNERLETNNEDMVVFFDAFGLTPLQILAAAAMDAKGIGLLNDEVPDDAPMAHITASTLRNIANVISDSAEILVRYGGRISIDPPPKERLNRIQPSLPQSKDSQTLDTPINLPHVNRSDLQIDSNATLMTFFGGSERLGNAKKEWDQFKQVPSVGKLMLHRLDSTPLVDSDAPGGTDEKSCAICWKAFGTIRNRKHKCRVSKRYVCDDCSGKRVVEEKEEFRVSDGQFNVAKIEAAKHRARQSEIKAQDCEAKSGASHARRLRVSHEQKAKQMLEKQEAAEKDELFGGVMGKAMSFIMGEDDEREGHEEPIGNMAATLGQTRDALNQRGEKLNSLGDKTEALAQTSLDFANMTKELEKQQSSFW